MFLFDSWGRLHLAVYPYSVSHLVETEKGDKHRSVDVLILCILAVPHPPAAYHRDADCWPITFSTQSSGWVNPRKTLLYRSCAYAYLSLSSTTEYTNAETEDGVTPARPC